MQRRHIPKLMRRNGFALIVTLLLVTMMAAVTTQMVTTTSVESLRTGRRANSLSHELAIDSALRVAVLRIADPGISLAHLDRHKRDAFEFTIGKCAVECVMVDDGAKLDTAAFEDNDSLLKRKLRSLGRLIGRSETQIRLRPLLIENREDGNQLLWFDQLFDDIKPGRVFRWSDNDTNIVWSDVVSCFGSGRVDVRRAVPEVLRVLFEDMDRSLASKTVSLQRKKTQDLVGAILRDADADVRDRVESRITQDLNRYAMNINTAIGGDRRRWFVVATINDHVIDIHYRGQLTW